MFIQDSLLKVPDFTKRERKLLKYKFLPLSVKPYVQRHFAKMGKTDPKTVLPGKGSRNPLQLGHPLKGLREVME